MGVFDVINEQGKRTYDLERDQARGNPTTIVVGTLVVLGVPDANAVTNPCKPRTSATLHEVTLELPIGETSPTDVTFDILKSGASVGSVTITAGNDEGVALLDVGFSRGDQLTMKATTPGSGYTAMTGHLVWQTTRDWWHPPVLMFGAVGETIVMEGDITVFSTFSTSSSGSLSFPAGTLADGVVPTGSYTASLTCTVTGPSPFPANMLCGATINRDDDATTEITASDTGSGTTTTGAAAGTGTISGGTTYTAVVSASWGGPLNDETVWTVHYVLTLSP